MVECNICVWLFPSSLHSRAFLAAVEISLSRPPRKSQPRQQCWPGYFPHRVVEKIPFSFRNGGKRRSYLPLSSLATEARMVMGPALAGWSCLEKTKMRRDFLPPRPPACAVIRACRNVPQCTSPVPSEIKSVLLSVCLLMCLRPVFLNNCRIEIRTHIPQVS